MSNQLPVLVGVYVNSNKGLYQINGKHRTFKSLELQLQALFGLIAIDLL